MIPAETVATRDALLVTTTRMTMPKGFAWVNLNNYYEHCFTIVSEQGKINA
jgi:hypothetical protein